MFNFFDVHYEGTGYSYRPNYYESKEFGGYEKFWLQYMNDKRDVHIFLTLVFKRYDKLADNLVNINNMFASKEEAIAKMKERTRKIKMVPPSYSNPVLQ